MRVADPVHDLDRHRGVEVDRDRLLLLDRRAELRPGALQLADLVEHVLELVGEVLERVLGLFDGDVAAPDERLGVDLPDAALGVDDVVHRGLGHRGVVALVVAAAPVAEHVDHDVVVPALPVLHGQLGHPDAGLGVVAVHVEHRRADHLRHVGAVLRRAGGLGGGGEPDLVVDDHVHGAAGAVAAQQREVQRLGHHALAGERGVAVQHQRHDGVAALALVEQVLLGAHDALRARGRRPRGATGSTRSETVVSPSPNIRKYLPSAPRWYFTSPEPCAWPGSRLPSNSRKIWRDRLADDVGQHVEPAAVRHADDDLVQLVLGGLVQHGVEQRDDGLAALEGEPLLADVLGLQERLERLGRVQLGQDVLLLDDRRASGAAPRCAPAARRAAPGRRCACTRCRRCGSRSRAAAPSTSRSFMCCWPPNPPMANSRSRSHSVSPWERTSRSGWRRWR